MDKPIADQTACLTAGETLTPGSARLILTEVHLTSCAEMLARNKLLDLHQRCPTRRKHPPCMPGYDWIEILVLAAMTVAAVAVCIALFRMYFFRPRM